MDIGWERNKSESAVIKDSIWVKASSKNTLYTQIAQRLVDAHFAYQHV